MHTITFPAQLLGVLRNGLHSEIGNAAEEIAQVVGQADREQHPEWYQEPLEYLDRIRALLDLIGWERNRPEQRGTCRSARAPGGSAGWARCRDDRRRY